MIHLIAAFLLWGTYVFFKSAEVTAALSIAYLLIYGLALVSFNAGISHQKDKEKKTP